MGRSLEVADRISGLRSKRRETQTEFAEAIGVAQQSVSDWESKTGDAVPSSDSYVRLGNLAPYPDCLWFWEEAGMSEDAMLRAAAKLLEERGQIPKSEIIALPRLQIKGKPTETGARLPWNARAFPNPGAAAYYVVQSAKAPLNRPGTIVILDTSGNDATDLQPFWDRVVLVESTAEVAKVPIPRPPVGVCMGRLCCAIEGGFSEYAPWWAVLCQPDFPAYSWSHETSHEMPLARWTISMTTDKERLKDRTTMEAVQHDRLDLQLVKERAKEELRLFRGCSILGRVIDWYRPRDGAF